jgi:hypothetical protein
MKILADWPRAKDVDPTGYAPLADFSCGSSSEWEMELNSIVRKIARTGGPRALTVRVTEDAQSDEFIGVGSYLPLPLTLLPGPPIEDAVCIPALGITENYRTCRAPDSNRIGEHLLEDVLAEIKVAGDGEMPPVWAIVHIANKACQRVLESHGFSVVKAKGGTHDLWFRTRGLDHDWWRS